MHDDIVSKGWQWAHDVSNAIADPRDRDAAQCAILIAYRAGLRAGSGNTVEVEYTDTDITSQIERYDRALKVLWGAK